MVAENNLKNTLNTHIVKKKIIMAGDFNMNLFDFEQNKKVQSFVNTMFGHIVMLIVSKPKPVTKKNATVIDHFFINSVTSTKF